MTTPTQTIEPGIFSGMSEEDYFALHAVSNSRLQPLLKSPAHCKYAMDHPSEPTSAMILGSAVDTLVFSPELFRDRFDVALQCSALTQKLVRCSKMGTRRLSSRKIWPEGCPDGVPEDLVQWFCSTHSQNIANYDYAQDQIEVLSQDQADIAYAMARSVLNHPGASVLLHSCEEFQLSLVWRENNLLCKGRLDGLSTELKTVIDLKKCQDASPEAFARSIATYGYHRQGAMYLRGATYHGIDVKNYVIIAVEESPPHAVALYTLTERRDDGRQSGICPSPVEYGNTELLRLLDLYERCEATGKWPGYAAEPVPISLPVWVMQRMERE